MQSISDFTEKSTSEIMDKYGAFFAFGTKQFEEARDPKVKKYTSYGQEILIRKNGLKSYITIDTDTNEFYIDGWMGDGNQGKGIVEFIELLQDHEIDPEKDIFV